MNHIIRYKKTSADNWYHLPLIASKAETIAYAKGIGKAEMGQPAYHEVQVAELPADLTIVWSSKNESTVSQTDME